MGKLSTSKMQEAIRKAFQETGRQGGKTAAANMTPEQRSARAKKAVTAREAKRKREGK